MKLVRSLIFGFVLLTSVIAYSNPNLATTSHHHIDDEQNFNFSFRPCDFWARDFGSSSYVCSYLGPWVRFVPEATYKTKIDELENRIKLLEERLLLLESRI